MLEVISPPIYHEPMTHTAKTFDLFWRNPYNYWREMKAVGETNIAWDRGLAAKMHIDPFLFSNIKFTPINPNWRMYVIGKQDAQEYDAGCATDKPKASYPVLDWLADDLDSLEFYLKNPWGDDPTMYNDKAIPVKERAVKGQAHKIFITNLPPMGSSAGKLAIRYLEELNKEWEPYCEIFIHRTYSLHNTFGKGFSAGSFDGREAASFGKVQLYNGKRLDPRFTHPVILQPYLNQFGWKFEDMEVASNRCQFNMQSIRLACTAYNREGRPYKNTPSGFVPDITSPDGELVLDGPKG